MKVDQFKFYPNDVEEFIKTLRNLGKDYQKEIDNLDLLIKEISMSAAWKDDGVKTEFINTCNSYKKIYLELIDTIFSRVDFLAAKSKQAIEIENLYKREQ